VSNTLKYAVALAFCAQWTSFGCTSLTSAQPPSNQPSFWDKIGDSVKSGTSKVAAAVTPKSSPSTVVPTPPPSGKAGPGVYLAMARMSEQAGKFDEAESQYQKALELDPNHLPSLLGYAHMEDARNNMEAATKIYQRALKKHAKDPQVHNDLGLCYHRRAMLNEATKELKRAVELKPDNKRYRNNLAAVYVDRAMNKEALAQLTAAHGEAVGNYNLGFLLEQKQEHQAALSHFRVAAEKDPTLEAAQAWVAQLSGQRPFLDRQPAEAMVADRRAAATVPAAPAMPAAAPAYGQQRMPVPSDAPAGVVRPRNEPPGLQFPQARRPTDPSDAMPPLPESNRQEFNRLPIVPSVK